MSNIERNKMIMWRMIDEIWNNGKFEVADELFHPEHMSPSAPDLPPGAEGVRFLAKMFREAMPDYRMTVDLMFADEKQVVGRFTQTGTHTGGDIMQMKASGRKANWTEIGVLEINDAGQITKSWYEVDMLAMITQLTTPTSQELIESYFELANAGKWDAWCDLFAEDAVYDEQLAGTIEGRETLRGMMKGFPDAYAKFVNTPKHYVVGPTSAAAVSHISAIASQYPDEPIEADAMLYLEFENGTIKYATNSHDSKPFAPFLKQIGAG